ncbi:type I-F CRISPR-associated endoribonuclease Cas6/Csy4 [Hahella aquimaris]|uniref:type I-F CRISPR-associated endoribonuclease Cas6/Csy4 n=1 Tax=Hahella sp. HNIBRBA332 TaxID=3015983 RepID=UPI00352BDA3B
MLPLFYSNIELRSGCGIAPPILAGYVVGVLHRHYASHPDCYATGFPELNDGDRPSPGSAIRVFAESRDALDAALDALEGERRLSGLAISGRIRAAPNQWEGPWVEYRRHRIPARVGKSEQHQESRLRRRAKRLAESQTLPYLMLTSASNLQRFSIHIQSITYEQSAVSSNKPDGYGLSRVNSRVLLPKLT